MIIAVIAQNLFDFKYYLNRIVNSSDIRYIYVESELTLKGINLNGVIITPKAKLNSKKRELVRDAYMYNIRC